MDRRDKYTSHTSEERVKAQSKGGKESRKKTTKTTIFPHEINNCYSLNNGQNSCNIVAD
jgi:hypothetical protein